MSDDAVVTIDDILFSENDEEAIIMGGADGEATCTFPRGYLKRQAVYMCKTCFEITGERAGICHECSLQCHSNHEIVELYTKRHFRCDCGNSKFKGAADCCLWEEKDDVNSENFYDQNFDGLFCTCSRPYPDPEAHDDLEMFQCGICEDWFHLPHLNFPDDFSPNENYEELTCPRCVERFPLLWVVYYNLMQNRENCVSENESGPSPKKLRIDETVSPVLVQKECLPDLLIKYGVVTTSPNSSTLKELTVDGLPFPSAIFWPCDWRTMALCTCDSCYVTVKALGIDFLLDPEDSISHYMHVGKQRIEEIQSAQDSALAAALSEMPHTLAINVACGINKLKGAMAEFLLKKREIGHIITEAEVKAFFDELKKDFL